MANDESKGLLSVDDHDYAELPLTDDLAWLRHRIEKLVEGGIYLLAGQPGIGKSTLSLQLALDLGRQGSRTLYILTEQSKSEIGKRARLLTARWPDAKDALSLVEADEDLLDIGNLPSFLAHHVLAKNGKYNGVRLIVVDSIQGYGLSAAATKQYKRIYEFCKQCKSAQITTLLVAHVTKKGEISGPKDLEHNVDCVLYMRKALVYRPLFVPKNRFGPAVLQPIPLQMDKDTTALRLSPHSESVSSVARSFLSRASGNTEAQAAVALPSYGTRGQITAPGLPRKEIEQILNCISQIPDMDIGDLSYTIQCRLPGEKRYRSLLNLPLAMALIASYLQRDIPQHHLYIGELDLLRRVREVPQNVILDLWDAIEAGELWTPIRIFCPTESAQFMRENTPGATVVSCDRLEDAIANTWPDIRLSGTLN
jgi:DNA repair protein RadA/Sms